MGHSSLYLNSKIKKKNTLHYNLTRTLLWDPTKKLFPYILFTNKLKKIVNYLSRTHKKKIITSVDPTFIYKLNKQAVSANLKPTLRKCISFSCSIIDHAFLLPILYIRNLSLQASSFPHY